MRYRAIFLDDGGVISDNAARAPQWRRLLGEFLPPLLGGTPEEWAAANLHVMDRFFVEYTDRVTAERAEFGRVLLDFATFRRQYLLDWLRGMCQLVGVASPEGDDATLMLAMDAVSYCTHRVHAPKPRIVEAIRMLHARGYVLYTGSGESSHELDGYLSALDVRELFAGLYGGDAVNTLKEGPEFYERILAHAGERPETSLFVDDNPIVLDWIKASGARSAIVGPSAAPGVDADHHAASLWELATTLESNQRP